MQRRLLILAVSAGLAVATCSGCERTYVIAPPEKPTADARSVDPSPSRLGGADGSIPDEMILARTKPTAPSPLAALDFDEMEKRLAKMELVQRTHHQLLSKDWELPEWFASDSATAGSKSSTFKRRDWLHFEVVGEMADGDGRRIVEVVPIDSVEDLTTAYRRRDELAKSRAAFHRAEIELAQSQMELDAVRKEREQSRAKGGPLVETIHIFTGEAEMVANDQITVAVRNVSPPDAIWVAFCGNQIEKRMKVGDQEELHVDGKRYVISLLEMDPLGESASAYCIFHVRNSSASR